MLPQIDSSGLGSLVAAYSSARSGGASLRLCNLGSRFNELLQVTKLYTVFEISTPRSGCCARPDEESVHGLSCERIRSGKLSQISLLQ